MKQRFISCFLQIHSKTKNYKMKNSFLILITMSIVLCACGSKKEKTEKSDESSSMVFSLTNVQVKSANLSFGNLELKTISSVIKVNGKIDVPPQNLVSVSVPMGGFLKSTKLLPGMHLSKGEVIATLEDQEYIQMQEDYLITKSKLEMAELEFNRQRDLNQSKATSDKLFQQAKAQYQSLKISQNALAEKLRLININPKSLNENNISKSIQLFAPFSGYVSKVNVNIGKYVNPSDVLFELVDPKDIHLNLKVFEKDLAQLEVGQKVNTYTNSRPNKIYACSLILISQDIAVDRTAEVHCHFDKYDNDLLPGMYMNAEIDLKNTKCLAVPEEAIVTFEGINYLFVKLNSKNKFELREVEVGNSENGWTQVINATIFENQKIVFKGAYGLLMALKNRVED
jgi:cobalt-zinc-cadmium efflux system membrane fusion protein